MTDVLNSSLCSGLKTVFFRHCTGYFTAYMTSASVRNIPQPRTVFQSYAWVPPVFGGTALHRTGLTELEVEFEICMDLCREKPHEYDTKHQIEKFRILTKL